MRIPTRVFAVLWVCGFSFDAIVIADDAFNRRFSEVSSAILDGTKAHSERATAFFKAAMDTGSDDPMRVALLEQAVEYGIQGAPAEPCCDVAEKALNLLDGEAPVRSSDWRTKRIDLYRRWYANPVNVQDKQMIGTKLLELRLEDAVNRETDRQWDDAANAYAEAMAIATLLKRSDEEDISKKQARAKYLAGVQRKVAGYEKILSGSSDTREVRILLLTTLVVDLDNPRGAIKYLKPDVGQYWNEYVPLASQPMTDLKAAACKELGDWYYRVLLKQAGSAYSKTNILVRAKTYYDQFLKYENDEGGDALVVRVVLRKIAEELENIKLLEDKAIKRSPTTIPKESTDKFWKLNLGGGETMILGLVTPGKFIMGSPSNVNGRQQDEGPQHEVTISKPYFMGVFEVTQKQYYAVMNKNPSKSKGDLNPVDNVTWNDAVSFCEAVGKINSQIVRLPTEAEWEYACRAGTKSAYCFGENPEALGDYAWFSKAGGKTRPVGQKKPNKWGFYDMHGNVKEFCSDWYGPYGSDEAADPTGATSGKGRVFRGGCYRSDPVGCRSSSRGSAPAGHRFYTQGFRAVMELPDEQKRGGNGGDQE